MYQAAYRSICSILGSQGPTLSRARRQGFGGSRDIAHL
jgi:hypothetical protein